MADRSSIEWTDATWNPITGCSVISPGCTNCYAMRLAGGRMASHPSRAGLTIQTKVGAAWTGAVRFNEAWLTQPLDWSRPRMIFVCAHSDLFHERVPLEWIARIYAVMLMAPQHTFQVLTKRMARARKILSDPAFPLAVGKAMADVLRRMGGARVARLHLDKVRRAFPLANVWLIASAEDQERAQERIPDLLDTPAAVRGVSLEPLLGPISLIPWLTRLDWVIVGGENGDRPMRPEWARQIRDDCAADEVPFFFKQWGTFAWAERIEGDPSSAVAYRAGKKFSGRVLDGRTHDEKPRIRAEIGAAA